MKKEMSPAAKRQVLIWFSITAEQAKQMVADTAQFIDPKGAVAQAKCVRLSFSGTGNALLASASNGSASLQKVYSAINIGKKAGKVVLPHTMLLRLSAAVGVYSPSTPLNCCVTKADNNSILLNYSFMDSNGSFDITEPQDGFMMIAPIDTEDSNKLIINSGDFVTAMQTCSAIIPQTLPPNADHSTQMRFTPYSLLFKGADNKNPMMLANDIRGHSVMLVDLPATNTNGILAETSNLVLPVKLMLALQAILPRTDVEIKISCDYTRLQMEVGQQAVVVSHLAQPNIHIMRKPAAFGEYPKVITAKVQAEAFKQAMQIHNTLVGGIAEEGVFNNYDNIAIDIRYEKSGQLSFNVFNGANPLKGCTGNVIASVVQYLPFVFNNNIELKLDTPILSVKMAALMKLLKAIPQSGQIELSIVQKQNPGVGKAMSLLLIEPILQHQNIATKALLIAETPENWSGNNNKLDDFILTPYPYEEEVEVVETEAAIEVVETEAAIEVVETEAAIEVVETEAAIEVEADTPIISKIGKKSKASKI